jgi:hypothetical protein
MMRIFKLAFTILLLGFLFAGCKKYPENKLWFKDPGTCFKGGKITSYKINGVDHMPAVRAWYQSFPYNYFGQKVDDVFEMEFTYDGTNLNSEYGEGTLKFSEDKKYVEINFTPKNQNYGAQNLFVASLRWKIMKLTKNGQMKIETEHEVKTYEIIFN